MATTVDTHVTEFKMTGAPQLLRALNNIAAAYEKIAKAQAKVATGVPGGTGGSGSGAGGGTGGRGGWATWIANQLGGGKLGGAAIKDAAENVAGGATALEGFAASAAKVAGPVAIAVVAIGALAAVAIKVKDAVVDAEKSLVDYGAAIMDIRDLSGESASESAKAFAVFQAAGIGDVQIVREMLKVAKDLRSNQGAQGLGLIGAHLSQSDTPLQAILKISQALHDLPGGLQKAEGVAESLGIRNAKALIGLARLTDAQKEAATEGAFGVSDETLQSIQDMGVQFNLVGQTIQNSLVLPFAQELLPLVKDFGDFIVKNRDVFKSFAVEIADLVKPFIWIVNEFLALVDHLRASAEWVANLLHINIPGVSTGSVTTGTEGLKGATSSLKDSLDANTAALQSNNQQLAKLAANGGIPGALSNWDLQTLSAQNQLQSLS